MRKICGKKSGIDLNQKVQNNWLFVQRTVARKPEAWSVVWFKAHGQVHRQIVFYSKPHFKQPKRTSKAKFTHFGPLKALFACRTEMLEQYSKHYSLAGQRCWNNKVDFFHRLNILCPLRPVVHSIDRRE
jgi:hypothetical protein